MHCYFTSTPSQLTRRIIRKALTQCVYEKHNILCNKLDNNFDGVPSFRYLLISFKKVNWSGN